MGKLREEREDGKRGVSSHARDSTAGEGSGAGGLQTPDYFGDNRRRSSLSKMIMSLSESGPWYEASAMMTSTNTAVNGEKKTVAKNDDGFKWNALVGNVRRKGEELIEMVAAEYEKLRGKDSEIRWVMMARKTGTTADKVAAFTVLLQDNAIANLKSLDAMLGLVTSKGGKRHAGMGIDALKELFVTSLLPDWKLKFLMEQPIQAQLGTREEECKVLLWYWEDCVKQRYEQFVASLEEASKDNLPFLKEKAVKTIYELLKSKPEQEQRLLSALVNKLGDPERKTGSNAGYYLSCFVTSHPNMKMVVVQEVDAFLFRPHLGLRSKYNAVVFLNQILLSNRGDGPKLARRLIDIYFSLFKVITTSDSHISYEKERSSRKKQRKTKKTEEEDGGVVEIDSRLLSALLTGVNRAFPFVAAAEIDELLEEHTPALFRLVHSKSFNVGVQALMLLYQLVTKKNAISDRLYRVLYTVLLSPGLSKSSKMEMFLGLVFKAMKSDISSKRMAAFAKRLMQVALQGAPQFACGCLLLLSEVLKSRPTLWHALSHPEDADDEIEHFEDVKDNDTSMTNMPCAKNIVYCPPNELGDKVDGGSWPKKGHYNARHRDPSFCNADQACWWELIALKSHAHPSVSAMAKTLLAGASILYDGDPLRDLAVGTFLDRFAEKKPKAQRKVETWHGSLPLAPSKKVALLPVGNDFLNLTEKEIAPEDVIFYKFYTSKVGKTTKPIKKVNKNEEDILLTKDDGLAGDESDDDEIDALLDEEEGTNMVLDDLSEGDIESEGEWVYHQHMDIDLSAANGEHIDSEEDDDFETINNISLDDNQDEHNFAKDKVKGSDLKEKGRRNSQSKQPKMDTRGRGKKAFQNKGVGKSPFADIDDYSHILEHDTIGAKRKLLPRKRKAK